MAAAPWALERTFLLDLVGYARRGEPIAAAPRQPSAAQARQSVAVIPIHGVIEHRSSFLLEIFGGAAVEDVRAMLRQAVADPQVASIVLDLDTPGGGVAGVQELAAEIRAARGSKRIVAVANTLAASAGYWLGAQADQVMVSPSGSVGSIGVFAVHFDLSRMYDQAGVTPTIIAAGEHKTDGNEFEPLSDAARDEMQARADAFYRQFVTDVAKGRRITGAKVEADYGKGAVLMAQAALAAGMVDAIGTLDDAIRLAASRPTAPVRAEDEEPDPSEVELPFRVRLEQTAEVLEALAAHGSIRRALRAKEGRRAFSDAQLASLRSIRDSFDALLTADDPPAEPVAPAPPVEPVAAVPTPAAPAPPTRFRSPGDWNAYLQKEFA